MLKQFLKYGLTTIGGYFFIFAGTYFLVDILKMSKILSYLITTSLLYIAVYIIYTKYIFTTSFSKKKLSKYVITIIFFWLFNNIFFTILTNIYHINYLNTIIINLLFFGIIRFFIQKKLIFN